MMSSPSGFVRKECQQVILEQPDRIDRIGYDFCLDFSWSTIPYGAFGPPASPVSPPASPLSSEEGPGDLSSHLARGAMIACILSLEQTHRGAAHPEGVHPQGGVYPEGVLSTGGRVSRGRASTPAEAVGGGSPVLLHFLSFNLEFWVI